MQALAANPLFVLIRAFSGYVIKKWLSRPNSYPLECRMFEVEDIREWQGRDVVDVNGKKIGELEAIYVDTTTDEPSFATIKVGLLGRQRLVFAPLAGATVAPRHVRVVHPKKRVKDAPAISTDGELPADDEKAVFAHYDLPYQAAAEHRRLARR